MEKMENENRRTSAGVFACIYFEIKWGDKDSNLGRRSQQIYSLPPLTARESPHIDEPT